MQVILQLKLFPRPRVSFRNLLALAGLLIGDLYCWGFHPLEAPEGRAASALCPCGREWRGRSVVNRQWRVRGGAPEEIF